MPTKITITLTPKFAADLPPDLLKFKALPPEDQEHILDVVSAVIMKSRESNETHVKNIRKTLAVGAAILRHVDSLEITEHE